MGARGRVISGSDTELLDLQERLPGELKTNPGVSQAEVRTLRSAVRSFYLDWQLSSSAPPWSAMTTGDLLDLLDETRMVDRFR